VDGQRHHLVGIFSRFFAITAQDLQLVGIRMTATCAAPSREILDNPHTRPFQISASCVRVDLKRSEPRQRGATVENQ
jgi:hypothetical protein